jgi:5-methylcytosine-specific restriction enzyme A
MPGWVDAPTDRPLPPEWKRHTRPRILARDPWCRLAYPNVCTGRSTEVDHIGDRYDHTDPNLRGVCPPCHKARTQQQAQAARNVRARPRERHPGEIT